MKGINKMRRKVIAAVLLVLLSVSLAVLFCSCEQEPSGSGEAVESEASVEEDGTYDSKEEVAEYLSIYKKLPKNYITKKEARKLGWHGGSLEKYAPGKTIGGDGFGNREKLLPEKSGRRYYECDIDTLGKKKRGPKRIIYSNDGLIYYTKDHYKSYSKMRQSA
jgi:guanyl-specific ribonuclease Sa